MFEEHLQHENMQVIKTKQRIWGKKELREKKWKQHTENEFNNILRGKRVYIASMK